MSQDTPKPDLFMDTVAGKIPISNSIGSAKVWNKDGVPRPDVHRPSLWLWSVFGGLLGLDHFYMRSPWTGIAKMLTFGGFMLWWVWDIVQIMTEADRIVNYGMSAPFDAVTGIAQGMIYDGEETNYKTNSAFGFWVAFKVLLGFTGISDIFIEKRIWFGLFKMIIFIIAFTCLMGALEWGFFSIIGLAIMGPFAIAVLMMWGSDVSILAVNPLHALKEGLLTPQYAYKTFQGIKNLWKNKDGGYDPGNEAIVDQLDIANGPMGILPDESIPASVLQNMFNIRHSSESVSISNQKGGRLAVPKNPFQGLAKGLVPTGPVKGLALTKGLVSTGPVKGLAPTKGLVPTGPVKGPVPDTKTDQATGPVPGTKTDQPQEQDSTKKTDQPQQTADPNQEKPTADPNQEKPTEDPNQEKPTADPNQETGSDTKPGIAVSNSIAAVAVKGVEVGVTKVAEIGAQIAEAIAMMISPVGVMQAKMMRAKMEAMANAGGMIPPAADGAAAPADGAAAPAPPAADGAAPPPSAPAPPAAEGAAPPPTPAAAPAPPPAAGGARPQLGGARKQEELSSESQIMAATVIALIAGGSLKGLVDFLMVE